MRKTLLLLLFCILFTFLAKGQQKPAAGADGSVSGKVADAANNEPIAFGTIVLIKKADNLPYKSIQTDLSGNFKFDNVAYGRYALRVSYVGYANYLKDSIFISAAHKVYALKTLKLHAGKKAMLGEVTVQAKKSSIQLGIDRKVFSVEQSLVSEGGSASDLLANVPSVSIDADGNVNLRGSANVKVLIDGKPSLLAGGTVSDILASIPASAIETIEVLTNPSSKYDPEGDSGIINIVLKKNKSLGFNGSAAASIGTLNTFNGNVNLAYQHKKINIYGSYSHRQNDRSGGGFSDRTRIVPYASPDSAAAFNQNSTNGGHMQADMFKAGIDYNLTDKTTVSFSSTDNIRSNTRDQNSTTFGLNNASTPAPVEILGANTTSYGTGNNHDFSFDLGQKFKKPKEELTTNVTLSKGNTANVDSINNTFNYYFNQQPNSQVLQTDQNIGTVRNWNLQADYTDPIGKNGKFEAGYRTTLNRSENNFGVDLYNFTTDIYNYDPTLSTDFIYDIKTHAVYSTYQQTFGKFGIQGGARVEKTIINTDLVNFNTANVQNYFRVYPSVFLTDKPTDDQTIQLSYSRRINRPQTRDIIPFLDRSDPLNYRIGNPNLMPEDIQSVELSYAKYWKSTTLTSAIYYRRNNDIVEFYRIPYNTTGTTETVFDNFPFGSTTGFEFIEHTDITPKWNVTTNLNLYQAFIKGTTITTINGPEVVADQNAFAYNGNITTNFTLPYSLSGQLRADYQGPQPIAQGRNKTNAGVDGAIKYDFAKHKASLSLNGRDIFNTRKFGYTTNDGTFYNDVSRRFQSRTFLLTLSYHFGGSDFAKKEKPKTPDTTNPDDNNGGGGPGAGQ